MKLSPGSAAWLVAFGWRVGWRIFWDNKARRATLLILGGAFVLLHVVAFSLLRGARTSLALSDSLSGVALLVAGGATVLVLGLLISNGIRGALETLFERGDLDLLLSSPLPPRRIFFARALSVVANGVLSVALFVAPILTVGLVFGLWRVLGVIPWLVSLSFVGTSVALLLTMGLVRWLGVRRARTLASVLGALLGAAFFLVLQARNLLGDAVFERFGPTLTAWNVVLSGDGALRENSALWFPARTAWLEFWPAVVTVGGSLAMFFLVVRVLENAFRVGAAQARTVARRPGRAGRGVARFRGGWTAVMLKEWRLISRDPLLIAQTLLQVLYLLPLAVPLVRGAADASIGSSFGSAAILLGGSLAGALARIVIFGEDAPDLLRLAPTSFESLRRAKLLAALAPVWALFLPLFAFLVSRGDPWWWLRLVLFAVSTVGAGLMYLWRPVELRRADLMRGGKSDWVSSLGVLATSGGLVAANFGLPSGAWWGAVGLALALAVPLGFWLFLRADEQDAVLRG
ncbi:hypothetical protein [Deinococcus yavapaiensis]|uniref:ABC-2 type transport system permease protein n=1 Tax=Deinococcus yavapaiensis KR-236 TaxID=694435 RepID=A0A318S9A0_9DEIO|nr:hypothetical protein [Deinococcus yavapaiensis]PYE55791.1 ABC-2 type transport system permease protein [Deinococcus yavapaiensis KR-236]